MKQTAKVTARGLYKGQPTIVEVIEYDGGKDENGDWTKYGTLKVFKDGFDFDLATDIIQYNYLSELKRAISERHSRQYGHHVYNPCTNTIEAYWLAFNHGDGFDEVPEIEVEGEIYTRGSPFSNEDTSGIVF